MQKSKQIFSIIPFKSVGVFELNSNINNYHRYKFIFNKCDDGTGWDTYKLNNSISLYTDNEIIVSIACRVSCTLNNFTLVGGHYSAFLNIFQISNVSPDRIYMPDDDDYQDVYDVDSLGMQLWVRNDIIITIFCSLH